MADSPVPMIFPRWSLVATHQATFPEVYPHSEMICDGDSIYLGKKQPYADCRAC